MTSIAATRQQSRGPLIAWGLWLVGVAFLVAILLMVAAPDSAALGQLNLFVAIFLAIAVIYPTVGAAIAARRPDHYAGWTLLGIGLLFSFALVCNSYGNVGLPPAPRQLPAANVATWVGNVVFLPVVGGLGIAFMLFFPNGHLPGRRWRGVLLMAAVASAAYAVAVALMPGRLSDDHPTVQNPFALPDSSGPALGTLTDAANLGIVLGFALAGLSLVIRYRDADATQRLQIKWVAYVGTGLAIVFPIAALQTGPVSDVAFLAGFSLIGVLPLAVAFAILRYRLYEIDRLINRTFVFGALTALLAGLYAASLKLLQALFVAFTGNESDAALVLTTLILATTLTPLKARLEDFASHHLEAPAASPSVAQPLAMEPGAWLSDRPSIAALDALVRRVVRSELEGRKGGVPEPGAREGDPDR